MPKTLEAARRNSSIASFEVLVRKVKETFLLGRQRVKQEMVRTYWQTGNHAAVYTLNRGA